MKILTLMAKAFVALGLLAAASVAGAAGAAPITILKDGTPVAGARVSLELADLGKGGSASTDANGNAILALDAANAGKIAVTVYVDEDCPNGETRVVLGGASQDQSTDCRRRRKIVVFWWNGGGHVTIDVSRGAATVDGASAPAAGAASTASSPASWSLGAAAGYADFPQFGCPPSTSGVACKTTKGAGVYQIDFGKRVGPVDFKLAFLKSTGSLSAATPSSPTLPGLNESFSLTHEWRASVAYPIPLGSSVELYPTIGVARVTGQTTSSPGIVCFVNSMGGTSCITIPGGVVSASTTRGFGGVGVAVGLSDRWSLFLEAMFEDNRDFGAMDSSRYETMAGARFRW